MSIAKFYSTWGGFEAYNMLGMIIMSLRIKSSGLRFRR